MHVSVIVLLLVATVLVHGQPSSSYRDYVMSRVLAGVRNEDYVEPPEPDTFVTFYQRGIQSYLQNDFDGCIHFMEAALTGYKEYYDAVARCRVGCEYERVNEKPSFEENPEQLHFFEGIVKKTLCLRKCAAKSLKDMPKYFHLDDWHKEQFNQRVPYEYLQLCYYKNGQIAKAVQATYTVLVVRPDDHLSQMNMKYYTKMDEFDKDMLRDVEEKKFVKYYVDGTVEYDKKNWTQAINYLEKSLELFIEEENDCRSFCEDGFDQGWFPDFVSSTANHFAFCLRCKFNCTRAMTRVRTERFLDVFPSHYEYLQLAYFNDQNLTMACKATKTYLLFNPRNAMMQQNLVYYQKRVDRPEDCSVREDGEKYFKRFRYETKLMKYIDNEFYQLKDLLESV